MNTNEPREPLAALDDEQSRLAEVLRLIKETAERLKTLETGRSFREANAALDWLQMRCAVALVENRTRFGQAAFSVPQ